MDEGLFDMRLREVFITREAKKIIDEHAKSGVPNEVGGYLVGKPVFIRDHYGKYYLATWIFNAIPGDCESSHSHVIIKKNTYKRVWSKLENSDAVIVGWYHTHPGIGVFLSETDINTMRKHFRQPYCVAIVIDPINDERCAFAWDESMSTLHRVKTYVFNGDNFREYLTGKYMEGVWQMKYNNINTTGNRFKRQEMISWWDQDILENAKILVIGAGTLGNEICKNLALLGVGEVTVIDNDVVEVVNLSRSVLMREEDVGKNKAEVVAKRMEELYPDIKVTALKCDIVYEYGAANYKEFDVVLMAVDNIEARIYVNRYCYMFSVPLINGGLDGLNCEVQTILPPETACYECKLSDDAYRNISVRYSCSGLRKDMPERKIPMVITSASIAAGFMVQEMLKILHDVGTLFCNRILRIDGIKNKIEILKINKRNNCLGHWEIDSSNIIKIRYSKKMTIKEIKEIIRQYIQNRDFILEFDKDIIYCRKCMSCGASNEVLGLAGLMTTNDLRCKSCGSRDLEHEVTGIIKDDEATLEEYKIPKNHVLFIIDPENLNILKYILLEEK